MNISIGIQSNNENENKKAIINVVAIISANFHSINIQNGTVALDGEREVELLPDKRVEVALDINGPYVVDVEVVLKGLSGRY